MKIKKYQGETEEQVINKAKNELGTDAIVLSIKKITPKGPFSNKKSPYFELTASYKGNENDLDKNSDSNKDIKTLKNSSYFNIKNYLKNFNFKNGFKIISNKNNKNLSIKQQLLDKQSEIESLKKKLKQADEQLEVISREMVKTTFKNKKYDNELVQFLYEVMIKQEINELVCEHILEQFKDYKNDDSLKLEELITTVYNKILNILEKSKVDFNIKNINDNKKVAKNIVFVGSTGVGKTTTIAKISSNIIINKGLSIAFITLDTYRIAAVEQLKTYAEILGSDVEVVYKLDELNEKVDKLKNKNDFIFFDTAGRSHKNLKNLDELSLFLKKLKKPDVYLVLSSIIKLEDMMDIINTYSKFTNFKIIFTKLDETSFLGNILNISYLTDKKICYLTNGQNVPNDIDEFLPSKITKALLGSIYK